MKWHNVVYAQDRYSTLSDAFQNGVRVEASSCLSVHRMYMENKKKVKTVTD